MAHAQKPDFVFRRNGRVHLNRRGRRFSRLLTAEVCASAVVMLDTTCSEVVWRVLATHFIRQFPLHFPSRASPCAISFQLESTYLLTPLRRVLFEKLTGFQLVKEFPAFYGTRRFIAVFTRSRYLYLSWARSILSMSHIPFPKDVPNLMSYVHCLGRTKGQVQVRSLS
jgi:hypothetical protein